MPKVYHMVLVKFSQAKAQRAAELTASLHALQAKLPGFLSVGGGPYASPEGLNQGYTHGYLMVFENAEVRNRYLTHPDHEALKQAILPDLEGVVAFDFEAD
jgi:hypothetical protein